LSGDEIPYRAIMDVDIAIRYSEDRLCEVTLAWPGEIEPFYRIVERREDLPSSLTEAMREARRLFAIKPWPARTAQ
jgi:hypothetical protein